MPERGFQRLAMAGLVRRLGQLEQLFDLRVGLVLAV